MIQESKLSSNYRTPIPCVAGHAITYYSSLLHGVTYGVICAPAVFLGCGSCVSGFLSAFHICLSSELLMCGGGVRGILLLLLVARCMYVAHVC